MIVLVMARLAEPAHKSTMGGLRVQWSRRGVWYVLLGQHAVNARS
jgi:hypothetical protein